MHQTTGNEPLKPGVYLSQRRIAPTTGCVVTSFSVVMTTPNTEPAMDTGEMHTIEHLGQAFLGNDLEWEEHVVHFGPMGSRTGFCLVLFGDWGVQDVVPLLRCMFESIAGFDGSVPRATPSQCGNFRDHDLPKARKRAERFIRETLTRAVAPCVPCAL